MPIIKDCVSAIEGAERHQLTKRRTIVVTGAKDLLGNAVYKTLKESKKWGKVMGTVLPK